MIAMVLPVEKGCKPSRLQFLVMGSCLGRQIDRFLSRQIDRYADKQIDKQVDPCLILSDNTWDSRVILVGFPRSVYGFAWVIFFFLYSKLLRKSIPKDFRLLKTNPLKFLYDQIFNAHSFLSRHLSIRLYYPYIVKILS